MSVGLTQCKPSASFAALFFSLQQDGHQSKNMQNVYFVSKGPVVFMSTVDLALWTILSTWIVSLGTLVKKETTEPSTFVARRQCNRNVNDNVRRHAMSMKNDRSRTTAFRPTECLGLLSDTLAPVVLFYDRISYRLRFPRAQWHLHTRKQRVSSSLAAKSHLVTHVTHTILFRFR